MMSDTFTAEFPQDILALLLDLGKEFHFDPLSSTESEDYFHTLLTSYRGEPAGTATYLRSQVRRDFQCFDAPPDWLQSAAWPFHDGKPMYFVGQLDNTVRRDGFTYGLMFYVFWNPEDGETRTITQSD